MGKPPSPMANPCLERKDAQGLPGRPCGRGDRRCGSGSGTPGERRPQAARQPAGPGLERPGAEGRLSANGDGGVRRPPRPGLLYKIGCRSAQPSGHLPGAPGGGGRPGGGSDQAGAGERGRRDALSGPIPRSLTRLTGAQRPANGGRGCGALPASESARSLARPLPGRSWCCGTPRAECGKQGA